MLEQKLVIGTPPDHKEGSTRPADNDGPTGKPGKDQEKKPLKKEEKPFHAHCAIDNPHRRCSAC
jgi:hypothetical protein